MTLNSLLDLEKSHIETTNLVLDHIQDVETSLQLIYDVDVKLLNAMKERITFNLDGENEWWLDNTDGFNDMTFAPFSPTNWHDENVNYYYSAFFGVYIDSEAPIKMLARFKKDKNFSLVSRLVQQNSEAGSGFAIWFCINDSYRNGRRQEFKSFIAEHAAKITQITSFQLYDNGNFYLPFSIELDAIKKGVNDENFTDCLKPFDDALEKVMTNIAVFTGLIEKIQKKFEIKILPV